MGVAAATADDWVGARVAPWVGAQAVARVVVAMAAEATEVEVSVAATAAAARGPAA